MLTTLVLSQSRSFGGDFPSVNSLITVETPLIARTLNNREQLIRPLDLHRRIEASYSRLKNSLRQRLNASSQVLADKVQSNRFWQTFQSASEHFSLRLCVLISLIPPLIVWTSVAFIDGLVSRNIRRYRGGRESAQIYHTAKRLFKPAIAWVSLLYLCAPVFVNPQWIYSLLAIVLPLTVFLTASRFKKYL